MSSRSRQPANIPYSNFWLVAAEDAVRPRASENRKNYANAVGSKEKRSKRCIMTARKSASISDTEECAHRASIEPDPQTPAKLHRYGEALVDLARSRQFARRLKM